MLCLKAVKHEWIYLFIPGRENPIRIKYYKHDPDYGSIRIVLDADRDIDIVRESVLSKEEINNGQ